MEIEIKLFKKRKKKTRKFKKPRTPSRQKLERELWTAFSLFIRKRDGICVLEDYGGCRGPLQAAHIIGRRKLPTKYHELNVWANCRLHNYLHNRTPEIYTNWFIRKCGPEMYSNLVGLSREPAKALNPIQLQEMTLTYKKKLEDLTTSLKTAD